MLLWAAVVVQPQSVQSNTPVNQPSQALAVSTASVTTSFLCLGADSSAPVIGRVSADWGLGLVTIYWSTGDSTVLKASAAQEAGTVRDLNDDSWLDVLTVSGKTLIVYWGSALGYSRSCRTDLPAPRQTGLSLAGFGRLELVPPGVDPSPDGSDPPVFGELDAATVTIIAPTGQADSGVAITPKARIANLSPQGKNIPVRFHIGSVYAETVQTFIQPFQAVTVSFPDWLASPLGTHAVTCSTMLAGDTWNANDAQYDSVTIVGRVDAAALSITAPAGTIDSGTVVTPTCSIANPGTRVESIPVRMRIGASYADTVTVVLMPRERVEVSFADWVASPVGLHAVRCSTMLGGDEVPSNNRVSGAVIVKPIIDAQAVSILAPSGYADSGTAITPECIIANRSSSAFTIPVRLTIGSGYAATTSKFLAPEQVDTVRFPVWTASPLGLHTVRCSTALAGDEHPENDTVSTSILVGTRIDAAAVSIVAPSGTVDSGATVTPVCRIANLGTRPAFIPARLLIGSGYDQTASKLLAPGVADTVRFPAWTASSLGLLAVRCSTALAGDTFPANDTVSGTVTVTARIDAELTTILAPTGTMDSGTSIVPRVTVTNNGTRTESIPVRIAIGISYEEMSSVILAPGASGSVSFPAWIAQPVGVHQVVANTYLSGDENPANDTAFGSVTVIRHLDAAAISILAPLGLVDSGTVITPRARIANYSTNAALVPVRFTIGSSYADTASVSIAAGETLTIAFRNWAAAPVGTHAVKCSTMLAGDENNANDARTDSVTVIAHRDARAVAILAPSGYADSGTAITPICRVANDGTSTSLIPVRLRIGTGYEQTRTKSVNPGASDTVHFPTWVASPLGLHTVRCSTALAGDEHPENDTVSTSILVGTRTDAAAVSIVAPSGTVDSGATVTPVCRIANLGTRPVIIPARLLIGSGYDQTASKLLAPGVTDTVRFPAWTASPLGLLAVRCSTALAGDTFPANDTVSSTVTVTTRIDAELTAILAPTGTVDSGTTIAPRVSVTNNGTRAESIPVRLRVGTGYNQTGSIILAPGASGSVSFPAWIAQPVGVHQVVANTYLSGDENPANDTAFGSVAVIRHLDAAAISILAPLGLVDTGTVITPRARIANYSTSAAPVPVRLTIGSSYADTASISVAAGETLTIAFRNWAAAPVGTHAVRCSTMLAGDENNRNDTVSASVTVQPVIDATPILIVAPAGIIDSGTTVRPAVTVRNQGSRTETVPVRLTIGTTYNDTASILLTPGQTGTQYFRAWTAQAVGVFAVRCSTMLALDQRPENDTISGSVTVIRRIDAASVLITAPASRIDSGIVVEPQARIANLGTGPALIPVVMQIGDNYSDTATALVPPGETTSVFFSDWTAFPLGTHAVRCSTALAGDEYSANDTVSASVTVRAGINAELTAILAPAGTLDSGATTAPRVTVTNHGTRTESIPVRVRVGAGYNQTGFIILTPGASGSVSFPAWIAQTVGIHQVIANTYLTGDQDPLNDTAFGSVTVIRHLDAAAISIIAPAGLVDSGTVVTPRARVANYSTNTVLVPVRLRIGSGYSDTTSVSVAPGETTTVSFDNWIASPVGTHAVRCSTMLAGDENNRNDTVSASVLVYTNVDAATVRIVAPTGTVDSGTSVTPQARIANYGTSPALVPARVRIGSGYSQIVSTSVLPGETTLVSFPAWIASPVGTHTVRCSTMLAGDTFNANDTASALVTVRPIIDATPVLIVAPAGTVDSGATLIPAVTVRNRGSRTETVPVRLTIGSAYDDTASLVLAAGATDTAFFRTWTAVEVGTFGVRCSTMLALDQRPENDTISGSVTVIRRIDAASVLITAPAGSIDSGIVVEPQARIANLGTSPALIPVVMQIGDNYSDTATALVPPGETTSVFFSDWTASPLGTHAIRCSTALAGDEYNANDTVSASVTVQPCIDAELAAILAPTGSVDSGTVVVPRILVTNHGTRTESIPVRLAIGTDYEEFGSVVLASGASDTVVLAAWAAQFLGLHQVVANTYLTGDRCPANDTVKITVTVVGRLDAAAISILAPLGLVDTGTAITPRARITNYSTSAALVPVRLTIGSSYADTASISVVPGETLTVAFRDWTAAPVGSHAVRCSTMLDGDENNVNDTVSATVTVRPIIDATPILIAAPAGIVDSGTTVTPAVAIRNQGSRTETVPARLTIGIAYDDTASLVLAPGQTDTLFFDAWTADELGTVLLRCSTMLALDRRPENDTISGSVTVIRRIDAAAVLVAAPVGVVDSGTVVEPQARVANLGTSPALIPVVMQIGDDYSDTANVLVPAGEITSVFFSDWTASPLGTHAIRCSTALAGDERPENDTAGATVEVVARVDAGVTAILAPVGPVDSGSVLTPAARVANNSSSTKDIPVRLDIGDFYSDIRVKALAPWAEDTVLFSEWRADELGTHLVRCSTALSGDENPANDTLSVLTMVRVRIDAEVSELLAPVGVADSGATVAPEAVVRNNSVHTQIIPVFMSIEPGYRDSTTVLLEPDSSLTLCFRPWLAGSVGMFTVCCSVALAGDVEPQNDTVRGTVAVVARHDVGCYRIIAPVGIVDSGTVVCPQAMVANYGLGPELVPVRIAIGSEYLDSTWAEVGPAESTLVTFTAWTAGPTGWLAVRCSTALATDTATGNDQATDSVLVVTHPDAAVTDLFAPTGTVDSGTVVVPLARVFNFGTSPAEIPVLMRIGEQYEQTRTKFLSPNTGDTVDFPAWVASPLGVIAVKCSTALPGDERPENDCRVDSVVVGATRDAATVALLAPAGRIDTGATIVPVAVVANLGTSPGMIPVRMRIGPDYDSVVTRNIQPGARDTVAFPAWTAAITGTHAVRCSTELPDDCRNENDFLDGSVTVVAGYDAASLEILSPKGTVDSGSVVTPVVRIANFSSSPAEIPVLLRIGSDYLRTRRKFLAPGASDTVAFRDWPARPHGQVGVTCSTALWGDEYPENNAIHESVYVHHRLDAAAVGIIVPVGALDSGRLVTPKARIGNYSPNPELVPVEMRIGDFYSSTRAKLLEPGAEDTVHFEVWAAVQFGRHAVRCTTRLDNDENPANDWQDGEVSVQWRDAATISILAPTGFITVGDTCIPRARVRNLGTVTERVPAVFRIGPLFARLAYADSLAPGDSAELAFAPWIAEPGEFVASCSTALHTDMEPANNKLEVRIFGVDRAVILEPDSACTAPPGASVDYFLTCTNIGNSEDTFDITSRRTRAGWLVHLLDSTGTGPLGDCNGNSIPDVGAVAPGGSVRFRCRVTVPLTEPGTVTDSTELRATSSRDRAAWDDARLHTTVGPRHDLTIAPDQEGETQPGRTRSYRFTVTNLGNVEDYADIVLALPKGEWTRELSDPEGKQLGDRNRNGHPDVGPLPPLGGSAEVALLVTPGLYVRLGEKDTATLTTVSFGDDSVCDHATAVTLVTGGIDGLVVEPDQRSSLALGDTGRFRLWVRTTGNIHSTVNLSASSTTPGWSTAFFDSAGTNELRDSDFDRLPDLYRIPPMVENTFTLLVLPPGDRELAGNPDSLLGTSIHITASLSGRPEVTDSAVVVITAVPRFQVHNFPNPFYRHTRVIFALPQAGRVNLLAYNRVGECVRHLIVDEEFAAGIHLFNWDGTNDRGRQLAPGIYSYLLELKPDQGLPVRTRKNIIIEPD